MEKNKKKISWIQKMRNEEVLNTEDETTIILRQYRRYREIG